jgi:hypothetical protein
MNVALTDTGPPGCRDVARPPGKKAGHGADKRLKLTPLEATCFSVSAQRSDLDLTSTAQQQDLRRAQLEVLALEDGDNGQCAFADLYKEFNSGSLNAEFRHSHPS